MLEFQGLRLAQSNLHTRQNGCSDSLFGIVTICLLSKVTLGRSSGSGFRWEQEAPTPESWPQVVDLWLCLYHGILLFYNFLRAPETRGHLKIGCNLFTDSGHKRLGEAWDRI